MEQQALEDALNRSIQRVFNGGVNPHSIPKAFLCRLGILSAPYDERFSFRRL